MHEHAHRVLHTPMISPNNYMHVHMYTHVNTCMYARLDVVIILSGCTQRYRYTHTHIIMHTPYAPMNYPKKYTHVHTHTHTHSHTHVNRYM